MNETVQITANQVVVMFLLMAVGFVAVKTKLLSEQGCAQLNKILLYIVTPAVMLNSFNRDFEWETFGELGLCLLLYNIGSAIAVACAYICVRGKGENARAERFATTFPNCGFMGIPLIQAALGSEAVIFASCGVMSFQIQSWTFGQLMLTGGGGSPKQIAKKAILNPGVIGSLMGITIFCMPFTLPGPIGSTVGHLANLNTPLAMVIVGSFVARADIKAALKGFGVWKVTALRLAIIPALSLPFYLLIRAPYQPAMAAFIMTCCPVGALVCTFCNMVGLHEGEKHGSALVSVSTLLSIASIPLMMLITPLFT